MRAVDQYRPLVKMVPVGACKRCAVPQPPHQGRCRVEDERRKHQRWKPPGPDSREKPFQPEQSGQKAQRDGADIAHEQSRGRPVENQESGARGRKGAAKHRKVDAAGKHRSSGIGAKAEQTHAARQAIRPVHEIVQIGHPDDDQCLEGDQRPSRLKKQRGGESRRHRMHQQADSRRQRAEIIDQRHGHHERERRDPVPRNRNGNPGDKPSGPDRDAAGSWHRADDARPRDRLSERGRNQPGGQHPRHAQRDHTASENRNCLKIMHARIISARNPRIVRATISAQIKRFLPNRMIRNTLWFENNRAQLECFPLRGTISNARFDHSASEFDDVDMVLHRKNSQLCCMLQLSNKALRSKVAIDRLRLPSTCQIWQN